jgi:hypothetical protein
MDWCRTCSPNQQIDKKSIKKTLANLEKACQRFLPDRLSNHLLNFQTQAN